MIDPQRVKFALELLEKLEKKKKGDFEFENAQRRLRILEILGR